MTYELIHGDCVKVLREMEDNSVDAAKLATHRMALSLWLRNGIMMCLLLRCGMNVLGY